MYRFISLLALCVLSISCGGDASSPHMSPLVPAGGILSAACANDGDCASGHCVEGVCCDDACGGATPDCRSCRASKNGHYDTNYQYVPGVDGTCGDVAENADYCPTTECAGIGICNGPGHPTCEGIVYKTAGTPCAGGTKMCDGMGGCT